MAYEPVIGLEIHAELLTKSKMFCGCPVVDSTSSTPNTSVCEICTGMPGTLPVINQRAVEYAIRVALALNCTVAETNIFARKNYFYPDLPKGYQISQYEYPLATNGWLVIQTPQGPKRVGIHRVHLEEDTGKLLHRDGYSLIDYNRSGVPLLEIVSQPDLHSGEEVRSYATAIRSLLRYLEVNSGDMEKGVIRFEANISVRQLGSTELGIRTEVKNLNSFRSLARAVNHEVERQSRILEDGGKVSQETLGWDEIRGETVSQRGKEEAHDYRYFPEPDLPPLVISQDWVDRIRSSIPELPDAKQSRFIAEYHLSPYIAGVLTADKAVADFFETAVSLGGSDPEKLSHWLMGDFFSLLHQSGSTIEHSPVSPQSLAELVEMVETDEINNPSAKLVLSEMFRTGRDARDIVQEQGLSQVSDVGEIKALVESVLRSNPDQVHQYLSGKKPIFQWLFGQIMRSAGGRANPSIVRSTLESALKSLDESHTRE